MKRLLLLLPLLAVSAPAWGQANVAAANHKVADMLKADRQFFPQPWNVVVLDERTWNSYSKVSASAFSVLDKHLTALRAEYVMIATPEQLHHTLMHEAGHAISGSTSEKVAEAFAHNH